MLSKKQIKNNISWLLTNARAPVKFLTYRYLLNEDENSRALKRLWEEVEKDRAATEIFSRQKQDGSWCAGGSWSLPPSYIPKGGYTVVSQNM